jgi:hypothetical protein
VSEQSLAQHLVVDRKNDQPDNWIMHASQTGNQAQMVGEQ